jgi:hypothetical protein
VGFLGFLLYQLYYKSLSLSCDYKSFFSYFVHKNFVGIAFFKKRFPKNTHYCRTALFILPNPVPYRHVQASYAKKSLKMKKKSMKLNFNFSRKVEKSKGCY